MVCPRCGAELDPSKRYCMKCGALNYNHPDNQDMKKYITQEEVDKANKEYYDAMQGAKTNVIEIAGKTYVDELDPKEKKKKTFVDTGIIVSLLIVVSIIFGLLGYFVFHFSIFLSILVACIYFFFSFYLLANISIFMKGGYSGFVPLVPFYSLYAYCDIALGNGWLFLISLIPIVGIFFMLYVNYKLAKTFGRNGWLTVFLPFIMIPLIAFNEKSQYQGDGKKYQKYVGKGEHRNTLLPGIVYSFVVLCFFVLCIQSPLFDVVRENFVERDIESIIDIVDKDISDGVYSCEDGSIQEDGSYYISFDDATKLNSIPIPMRSSINGEVYSGYIRVDVSDSDMSYHYVITDNKNTYSDMGLQDTSLPEGVIICEKVD